VDEVEVGEVAVRAGVYAHGDDPDAVVEGCVADAERGEERGWGEGEGCSGGDLFVWGCSRECWVPLCCEGEAPLLIVKRKWLSRGDWEGIETEGKAASSQWLAAWGRT